MLYVLDSEFVAHQRHSLFRFAAIRENDLQLMKQVRTTYPVIARHWVNNQLVLVLVEAPSDLSTLFQIRKSAATVTLKASLRTYLLPLSRK